jgi:hypothetical protein
MYLIYNVTTGEPISIAFSVEDRDSSVGDNAWIAITDPNIGDVKVVDGVLVDDPQPMLDYQSNEAREKRNTLLSETDWWAMSDRTMTAEQTAYRQALRDITAHANWPNLADSDWPTKPE